MGNVACFLLGLGAAWVVPIIARVARPLAVEATAAGMGLFDDARRVVAEQLETLDDIAAEARARREELLAGGNGHGTNGHHADEHETVAEESDGADAAATGRSRRRAATRRRTS